jgi:hypothetical protein
MNRAQFRMTNMIDRFKENLNGQTIGEYFQVPMKITIQHEDVLNVTCKFSEKKEIYVKLELPFEVNCIILNYLYEHSYGEYQIIIPNDYPFKPPIWVLINSNKNKYKKAETYQNAYYRDGWMPCISVEKDILYMIEALNL